jgi:hypothetical protein
MVLIRIAVLAAIPAIAIVVPAGIAAGDRATIGGIVFSCLIAYVTIVGLAVLLGRSLWPNYATVPATAEHSVPLLPRKMRWTWWDPPMAALSLGVSAAFWYAIYPHPGEVVVSALALFLLARWMVARRRA